MLGQQFHRVLEIAVFLLAFLNRPFPESAFFVISGGKGAQHGLCDFPLAEIVAGIFADGSGFACVIECIIGKLERDAEAVAIGIECASLFL